MLGRTGVAGHLRRQPRAWETWLWERWRPALEPAGMDREASSTSSSPTPRVWPWLMRARTGFCAPRADAPGGAATGRRRRLSGRVLRRLPERREPGGRRSPRRRRFVCATCCVSRRHPHPRTTSTGTCRHRSAGSCSVPTDRARRRCCTWPACACCPPRDGRGAGRDLRPNRRPRPAYGA